MSKGKWLNNIARLVKKHDKEDGTPGGYFLVFERRKDKDGNPIGENCFPLTIEEGTYFQARVKKDELQKLVDAGEMKQETADKISKNTKFEFSLAPREDEAEAKPAAAKTVTKTKKKSDSDEVDF